MKFSISEKYNSVVLKAPHKLVGGTLSEEMRDILHQMIDENKKNIIVDLGDVTFVNSTGIGILISGFTTMKNGGGNFVLANISDKTRGLLSVTKLNTIFKVYPNIDEAANIFNKLAPKV